jgi:hypothetical protein
MTSSFGDNLREFYEGEVLGEALYSGLLDAARNARERQIWGVLLQLETETKAWLRGPMTTAGVSLVEPQEPRERAARYVKGLAPLGWRAQMQTLHDVIGGQVVPRFLEFAEAAVERGATEEESVCRKMVEHEEVQAELARRELAGEPLASVLAPVAGQLRYPFAQMELGRDALP